MRLTNEEIEAAREDIKRIWSSYFPANTPWTIAAEKALDALCAAARQPKSLAGKRVAVRAFSTTLVGTIAKESRVWIVEHKGSQAGPVAPGELTLFEGDDFEILEGDIDFASTDEGDELTRRLSALRAENERLKTEAVVMRKLCEADAECAHDEHTDSSLGAAMIGQLVAIKGATVGDLVGKVEAVLDDGRLTVSWGFSRGPWRRDELQPIDSRHKPCNWPDEDNDANPG